MRLRRELAAQAQYRLSQALLQKGDLTTAAREFDKLARDYADYRATISSLATGPAGGRGGRGRSPAPLGLASFNGENALFVPAPTAAAKLPYDGGRPVQIRGKLTAIRLLNPLSTIMVDEGTSRYFFVLGPANELVEQGFTRAILKIGDAITVNGVLSTQDTKLENAIPARADTVVVEGKTIFDRSKLKITDPAKQLELGTTAEFLKSELVRQEQDILRLNNLLVESRAHLQENHPDIQVLMRRLQDLKAAHEDLLKKQSESQK